MRNMASQQCHEHLKNVNRAVLVVCFFLSCQAHAHRFGTCSLLVASFPLYHFYSLSLWRCPWVSGHLSRARDREMCWGFSGTPLPPRTWGRLGRGGGDSKEAEGSGTCRAAVQLKAAPQRQPFFLLLSVPCWEGPVVLCARPRRHRLQPHPAAAAARRQCFVQLPAASARSTR